MVGKGSRSTRCRSRIWLAWTWFNGAPAMVNGGNLNPTLQPQQMVWLRRTGMPEERTARHPSLPMDAPSHDLNLDRSKPIGATRSEAAVQLPKKANVGRGKTPSGTGQPPRPWSRSSRTSTTTAGSRRRSLPTTTPGPRSSGSWCSGWHRYYGDYVGPQRSRLTSCESRPRS